MKRSSGAEPQVVMRTLSAQERELLIARICAKIADFSLAALLATLSSLGYQESQIELRSNITTLHQPSLISSIQFESEQLVIVTLNYGLLAAQSPLPSYVLAYVETQNQGTLLDFLQYLAHHLLRQLARGQREIIPTESQRKSAQNVLCLLGCKSTSTLHWLFAQVFPELEVRVEAAKESVSVQSLGVRLGSTCFGDGSSFGGRSSVLLPRVSVTLLAEEPICRTGTHWYFEARKRLRLYLVPLLLEQQLYLSVTLLIRSATDWLRIGRARQLGVEPFLDVTTHPHASARRVPLFQGEVTRSRCAALDLDGADQRSP